MKFKIGATIPTVQYGNIMPEIEVEADSLEEAQAIALPYIEKLWARYAETGRELRSSGNRIEAFVGGSIDYDALTHVYSWNGETYLSGSQYAKQFEEPFDAKAVSELMAKNIDYSAEDIRAMWALKSAVSNGFGTAIHAAIEMYDKYKPLSEALDAYRATKEREAKHTHHHDHPILKTAVEGFYALQDKDYPAETEMVVVDHTAKRAGRIDRLLITGDKRCRIQDIKTNGDNKKLTKSLPSYWKQLGFYGDIMKANDWVVEGLDIFHWDGTWNKHTN